MQMARLLDMLTARSAESSAGAAVAGLMDSLVNVYVPACAAIGWLVRRCYWEGRAAGTGCWGAQCLRQCLLLLCGLLGERVRFAEYARSIGVALLTWSPWHDSVPAAAYVEEACEAQLSQLSSTLKRNPHATGVGDVSDLYVLLPPASDAPHAAKHHPVSSVLQHTLLTNMQRYVRDGPRLVTYVPWRSGKTCVAKGQWPATNTVPHAPWDTTFDALSTTLLHTVARVHRGDAVTTAVADICDDFLPLTGSSNREARSRAAARATQLASAHAGSPPHSRALRRQLEVRDRTDPPPKRRALRVPRRPPVGEGTSGEDLLMLGPPAFSGPRLVGIPLE
jgi:hypothetical protein